jgi:hypothetical protein
VAISPANHSENSRFAAYVMWGNTTDRAERLRNAHNSSPSGYLWHARRLFGQDLPDVESLTKTQLKQVHDARLAWLRANAIKAVRGRKLAHARQLRERAAAIEAEAAGDE